MTASSTEGGYPDDKAGEWSAGSKVGALLTLTWDTPLDLRFPARTITLLTFKVTGVKPSTENAGLSEIAVFRAK